MKKNENIVPINSPGTIYNLPQKSDKPESRSRKASWISFMFIFIMVLGFSMMILWFWYGILEESVPGVGQVVPQGHIKRIMSPVDGIVSKMYVKDDQVVKAGQVLFELDPEYTNIEQGGIKDQLTIMKQEADAIQAAYTDGKSVPASIQGAWALATKQAFQAQMESAKMQQEKVLHQYLESMEKLDHSQKILATSEKMLSQYQQLYDDGGLPEKDLKEFEQKVIDQRGIVAETTQEVNARKIELEQAQKQPNEIIGNYQKELLGKLTDQQRNIAELKTNMQKTHVAFEHQLIKAPIDGIVNEKIINGPGEIVRAGEPLLTIVPDKDKIIAEINVANKDLGYIHLGQRITLKFEAYPYQHFGKIYGTVVSISPSSIQNKEGKSFYVVRAKPDKTTVVSRKTGKKFNLLSGMSVSADFITQKKNILEFFVDPVRDSLDRAFRDPTSR